MNAVFAASETRCGPAIRNARPSRLTDTHCDLQHDTPCDYGARVIRLDGLSLVPILPDGSPDCEYCLQEATVALGLKGSNLDVSISTDLPASLLRVFETSYVMIVLQGSDNTVRCAGLEVHTRHVTGANRLQLGGRLGGLAEELLQPEKLTPRYDAPARAFRLGFAESVLRRWAELGILQPVCGNRILVCPKCHGLPTFRRGCQQCGSAQVAADQLIHHFACAHVGFLTDFETPAGLLCPKCRTRELVVGADYEYLDGPYRCSDCHWSAGELEHVAQCLDCQFLFPGYQAHELDLGGYRADRLDLLALLQAR
jgi:hypothetical protein